MPYCTSQDLIDRFGEQEVLELTDRNQTGVIDKAVLEQAIADADAEIDAYLAGRYKLPLGHVPAVLPRIACDLVRYYLYEDHSTEYVQKRYDDATKFLRSVARGDVNLGLSAQGSEATPAGNAQMETGGRVWDRNDSKGFI
jgi:phage gp36-like protein